MREIEAYLTGPDVWRRFDGQPLVDDIFYVEGKRWRILSREWHPWTGGGSMYLVCICREFP